MKFEIPSKCQFIDEIKQYQDITNVLINKILFSRRLLIDHVQSLEQCLVNNQHINHVDGKELRQSCKQSCKKEICTLTNFSILTGITLLERFLVRRALHFTVFVPAVIITTTFGTLYGIKKLFGCRNRVVENDFGSLIRTIDDFGNCIRRNITYFNEIIIMKQHELIESRQCERAWDCITAAKEVIEILYDGTRSLESHYPLPNTFTQYYCPMEDLKECNYFKNNVTNYSPKHIKDFHNIFAYVQSQFLLRLALTILMRPSLSQISREVIKIDRLIRRFVLEEENHFKNLAIEINKKQALDVEKLSEHQVIRNRHDPVSILQDSSLKLSACMVAVAGECQALDTVLQGLDRKGQNFQRKDNAKQLAAVANNMHSIESALNNCYNDFQRLLLVYNKFLNSQMIEENLNEDEKLNQLSYQTEQDLGESVLRVEISEYPEIDGKEDDFYAYLYDSNQPHHQNKNDEETYKKHQYELEILNFEKRLTRSKFRPVLKQLKERIDPIKQLMLEKEREVLMAKGINVDKLFQKDNTHNDYNDDGTTQQSESDFNDDDDSSIGQEGELSDSDGSIYKGLNNRSKKFLNGKDQFEEMRNFLTQKSQNLNLLSLNASNPSNVLGEEDIIE